MCSAWNRPAAEHWEPRRHPRRKNRLTLSLPFAWQPPDATPTTSDIPYGVNASRAVSGDKDNSSSVLGTKGAETTYVADVVAQSSSGEAEPEGQQVAEEDMVVLLGASMKRVLAMARFVAAY